MKRWVLVALVFVFVFALPLSAQDEGEWPRTVVDGLGNEITIDAPPQNIVSLSLGVDEVLLPLIGPERFAAITALSLDPGISNVAVLASQVDTAIVSSQDTEQIITLAPDLVFVASFTAPEVLQQLRDAGLTVFATNYSVGVDQIRDNVRLLGYVVGEEAGAEALIESMATGTPVIAFRNGAAPEVIVDGVTGLNEGAVRTVSVKATKEDGSVVEFDAVVRIDTPGEADYYRNGGILQYVLRNMIKG